MSATKKTKSRPLQRHDGRRRDEIRPAAIEVDFIPNADGSCLIALGRTRVICTATIAPGVPAWLEGKGRGWVTAEYGMLPASTGTRKRRPIGRPDGRSTEIQRIIGRVLRGAVRMDRLGDNTIHLDCDVIAADGGTRTAAITGAQVALARALAAAEKSRKVSPGAIATRVAAVSVGIVGGECMVDLDYQEDSAAQVDMNVAVTATGRYVEIQASAESGTFTRAQLDKMLQLARRGCRRLAGIQDEAIAIVRRRRK